MIIENIRFLELASTDKIYTPLKSFSDSILFYYLGQLALKNDGDLFEIGCGGSTFVLYELSENENRKFNFCDLKQYYENTHSTCYPNANVNVIIDDSRNIRNYDIGPFVYSHVDGTKDYVIAKQDLEYCIDNIAGNGLICQDDYGNNKWPTITRCVTELVHEGKLKFVFIGDSSAWLTTPEYYDYWMNLLQNDREFLVLSLYLGIRNSSTNLSSDENYYFINTLNFDTPHWGKITSSIKEIFNERELKALYEIDKYKFSERFLKMPYTLQSVPGNWLEGLFEPIG